MDSQCTAPLSRRQRWIRFARYVLPLLLLGIGAYLLLPRTADLEHSLQVIQNMTFWVVALAVGVQVLSYLGSGYLLRAIALVTGQRLPLLRGVLVFAASVTVGLVGGGPVGSMAVTYRWLRDSGVSRTSAMAAGWLPSVLNSAILALIGILGLGQLLIVHHLTTLQAIGFGIMLGLLASVAVVVLWGMSHRSQLTMLVEGVARRWAILRRKTYDRAPIEVAIDRLFSAWDRIRAGGWRGLIIGAAAYVIFDMGTLYLLFVATGYPISLGVLLAGYGLPLLLGKVSFLPGGVGVVEATMTALYNGLGVPDAVTVVVILAYRLISFWLPMFLGFPMVFYLQWIDRRIDHNGIRE